MYRHRELDPDVGKNMICDFCAAFHPTHIYAANRMSTGLRRQCWRWAACHHCNEAIEALDWDTLRERVKSAFLEWMPAMPDQIIEYAITKSMQEFFEWAIEEPIH